MFGAINLEEMGKRILEMQEENLEAQSSLPEEIEKFDFAGRLGELTSMLENLAPLKDVLEGLLDPSEMSDLSDALDECHINLDKMNEEVKKLNDTQGE